MNKWLGLIVAMVVFFAFSTQVADAQTGYVEQGVILVPVNLRTNEKLPEVVACTGLIHSVAIVPGGEKAYVIATSLHDHKWQVCSVNLKTESTTIFSFEQIDLGNTELPFPPSVRVSPLGKWAFVVDTQGNRVIPIDVETDAIQNPIAGFLLPYDIAFAPNSETAYVTNLGDETGAGFVLPFNLTTLLIDDRIPLTNPVNTPASIVITPNGEAAFITRTDSKDVTYIDLQNGMEQSIELDNVPDKMVILPDGQSVYLSGRDAGDGPMLMRIGVKEKTQDDPISLASLGQGAVTALAASPDSGFLYIGLENANQTFTLTPMKTETDQLGVTLASFSDNFSNIEIVPDVFPTNKVYFIGDSVTAGFGYCGQESSSINPLSSCAVNDNFSDSWRPVGFTLGGCAPPDPIDNRCSNNNIKGEPWTADNWKNDPSSPKVAYPFVIARKQAPDDAALIQSWAMTGSQPSNWDPIEVADGEAGRFTPQVKQIKDSYVVMTLGANPILNDYLKIKGLQDGQCAAATVVGNDLSAQPLDFTSAGLGACFKRRWDELQQGEHLENLYKSLLSQGNHVLVVGYPVVCPWSFGNWQPFGNVLSPSKGKPCDSLEDKTKNITQWDQASWLAEQANLLIQEVVTKTRADLNTENIQFAAPNELKWAQHQAWMKPSWVFKNDTWVHPNYLGHRELANTVIKATCRFFGHWCNAGQNEPLRWSASENDCLVNRAVRDAGRCEEPLMVNPCLGGGWQNEARSDGSAFDDESACTTYVDAGGSIVSPAMLVLEDVRVPPMWGRLTGSGLMPGADTYACFDSAGPDDTPGCFNAGVRTDASGNLLWEKFGGCPHHDDYNAEGVYFYTTKMDGTTIISNVVDQTTCSNQYYRYPYDIAR